jgi:tRNA(Phe) wybutosine-synthesizing methylase Tyw3
MRKQMRRSTPANLLDRTYGHIANLTTLSCSGRVRVLRHRNLHFVVQPQPWKICLVAVQRAEK